MRQEKKIFKRVLSVMLSTALAVTSGAFQANSSTVAQAAETDSVSIPNTSWKLYADDIAVDSAGVKYKWNQRRSMSEAQVKGVTDSFSSREYEISASIPATYVMYKNLYLKVGSADTGNTPVTEIADEAFFGVTILEKVTIPEGIIKIGSWAFNDTSLKEITIPKSVTSIGKSIQTATDGTDYGIFSSKISCKVYCWKDSYADKYFTDNKMYPNVTKEYLSDAVPSTEPTVAPTATPSAKPTTVPSVQPTATPGAKPTTVPSVQPTATPSAKPTAAPSSSPSTVPTAVASTKPTVAPGVQPSVVPTNAASAKPTPVPTKVPVVQPSGNPVIIPPTSSAPSITAAPVVTAIPEATGTPSNPTVSVPTSNPSVTKDPVNTVGPVVTVPTEAPDSAQNTMISSNDITYQIDQSAASVTVADMKDVQTKKITIPSVVTVNGKEYPVTGIENNAFAGNKNIKEVSLGKNVKKIGTGAFKGCTNLTEVKFPSNLSTLGKNSFYNCKNLKKVSLPVTVKKIGVAAFKNCKSLKTLSIGKNPKTKKGALSVDGQKIRYGASSVKLDISASAFENCVNLRQMVINSLVRRIGNSALKNCRSLRDLIVNSKVLKEVAKKALKGVSNCKISVPSVKLKPYSVLFKNKGQGKKVIVAKM